MVVHQEWFPGENSRLEILVSEACGIAQLLNTASTIWFKQMTFLKISNTIAFTFQVKFI